MPRKFGRRGRGQIVGNYDEPLNFGESGWRIKQQHAGWREDKRLGLLGKKSGACQRTARLVAVLRAGRGLRMSLRATIPFAQQTGRIKQTARSRWQPNKRQQHRHDCLDTLHGESNTTEAGPGQSGRLADRRGAAGGHHIHGADGYSACGGVAFLDGKTKPLSTRWRSMLSTSKMVQPIALGGTAGMIVFFGRSSDIITDAARVSTMTPSDTSVSIFHAVCASSIFTPTNVSTTPRPILR